MDTDTVYDDALTRHTPKVAIIGRLADVGDISARLKLARKQFRDCPIIGFADQGEDHPPGDGQTTILARRATLSDVAAAIKSAAPSLTQPSTVARGDTQAGLTALTPAQNRVLVGLMNGRLNKQIAHDMQISEATVKAHVTAVFRKLGVRTRTQAVIAARELQMAPLDG